MKENRILVIGSSNTDMTVKSEKIPTPGETVLGGVFSMGHGGKGANQAVAAARLGGKVSFICKVGNDLFGKNSVAQYEREGLDTSNLLVSDLPSGVALINVDASGENSITVAPGANMDLSADDIEKRADAIRGASILLMQLEIPVSTVLKAAQIAHEAGVAVILNPAPACDLPDELLRIADYFIPNETELARFSGMAVDDRESIVKACVRLHDKGVGTIILTRGSRGSLIYKDGEAIEVPSRKVKAVDTTGAGDTFCGALCVALSEGKDVVESVGFATAAASLTVQKMGAQASLPYRNEIIL